jgi:hypothetical protein
MPELAGKPQKSGWVRRVWYPVAFLLYVAGFALYSQTRAFAWDESYHLLAAQLILSGKTPYLDFCFPQSPLNAYWNAAWMWIFGQSWRTGHAAAGLLTLGAVLLMADFVARRFPAADWRRAAGLFVALAIGLNPLVFVYGTLSQPYGMCLFTCAAAFRLSVYAVSRRGPLPAAGAGLFAGVAAGSSLLSAAATPVLLLWMLIYNRKGSRRIKGAAFLGAAAIPFLPVLWLFARGARQTWFNLVQYHASFRKLYWPETTQHDIEVLVTWIDSGPALILGLLAILGLVYVARRSGWTQDVKAEFYLCAWLALALAAEVGRAHPTFPQYFVLIVPYVAVLAAVGLYAIGAHVLKTERPLRPVMLVLALSLLGLVEYLYNRRDVARWAEYERLAAKVNQVTPTHAALFATEPIYFLTRRTPPGGLELFYSHRVNLPPGDRVLLHLLTQSEMKQQVQSGRFATAYTCDDDQIEDYGLKTLYRQRAEIADCSIFWDLGRSRLLP